jgi:iron complex outermembrane receptor protein
LDPRVVRWILVLFVVSGLSLAIAAAASISGRVTNTDGVILEGAYVLVDGAPIGASTDARGDYILRDLESGVYRLVSTHIGYGREAIEVELRAENAVANFSLHSDPLALSETVVTGVFNGASKLNSSIALTTLNHLQIDQRRARGTGDLLSAVPGHSVDTGGGEVGAQIYPRGLSAGAVADIGFKYSSLQEDGLPVMSTQFQFAVIDMFHRPDASVERLEAIRGGSASTSAANSPGGIFNFISKTGGSKFRGEVKLTGGVQGDGNSVGRTDFNLGGPLGSLWTYNLGGFYRRDEGARDLPFTANEGGQLKGNLRRSYRNGSIMLYGKALADQVIFFKQLPVADLGDDHAIPGFDLNTSSLIVDVKGRIPSAADPDATRGYDAGDGIQVSNYSVGAHLVHEISDDWQIGNNLKFGVFRFDHFQSSGHNLLNTVDAPNRIHRLSSDQFNSYTYRDAKTGELLARYENGELLGENLLGDRVLLTLAKTVTYDVYDFIDQLSVSRSVGSHRLTSGLYFGYSDIRNTLNLDFVLGRFEPNPRLLQLTHPNPYADQPGQPSELQFTDDRGYFAYGFGTYTNFEGASRLLALFLNDSWQIDDRLNLDVGLRIENSNHSGKKEIWDVPAGIDSVSGLPLGRDGDHSTFYDEFFKSGTGEFFDFDFGYPYWSGSVGANYLLGNDVAAYGRLTRGIKSPESTYYINNFVNSDFEKGFEEEIVQAEAGLKINADDLSMSVTGFYSRMSNIPFQILVVSGDIGQFTPATFNTVRTLGTEVEVSYRPRRFISVDLIATIQDPKFVKFKYYNINRTGSDFSDDFIERFDGNTINEVPDVSFDLTPSYRGEKLAAFLNWKFVGQRQANRRNTLKLPAFSQIGAGASARLTSQLTASLNVSNLFNSKGLTNFEGVGIPGTSGEDVTEALLENVVKPQNRPFFARPILPRAITLSLTTTF